MKSFKGLSLEPGAYCIADDLETLTISRQEPVSPSKLPLPSSSDEEGFAIQEEEQRVEEVSCSAPESPIKLSVSNATFVEDSLRGGSESRNALEPRVELIKPNSSNDTLLETVWEKVVNLVTR